MPEEFKNLSHLELTPVDWTEKGFYYEDTERPARHPFYYASSVLFPPGAAHTSKTLSPGSTGSTAAGAMALGS